MNVLGQAAAEHVINDVCSDCNSKEWSSVFETCWQAIVTALTLMYQQARCACWLPTSSVVYAAGAKGVSPHMKATPSSGGAGTPSDALQK